MVFATRNKSKEKDMARYIRLYESPTPDIKGNILGFSRGIAEGAQDPTLHQWFTERGYRVTAESDEQRKARYVGGMSVRTVRYHEAAGVPVPQKTVSVGHLLVEPPVKNSDLQPLGEFLRGIESIDGDGMYQYFFIDSRDDEPRVFDFEPIDIIAAWD